MQDATEQDSRMTTGEAVWKTLAIALLTFILGASIPLFVTRDDVRPGDLDKSLVPIQAQLSQIQASQDSNAAAIVSLQVNVASISENLRAHEKPTETEGIH